MKNRGIAFKLVVLIICGINLIFGAVFGYNYFFTQHLVKEKIEQYAQLLTRNTANRIDAVLKNAEKVPESLSRFLEYYPPDSGDFNAMITDAIKENTVLFGVCMAYEPYAMDSSQKLFAPYLYRKGNVVSITRLTYDYLDWDWYKIPKQSGRPAWSDPYFDDGGGNIIMATYSCPVYQTRNGVRRIKGIATADIALSWLQEMVSAIKIAQSGYAFLITKKGTFVTHPRTDLIMNKTLFNVAEEIGDKNLADIGQHMVQGNTGFVSVNRLTDGKRCWMAYGPLTSNGWSLGVLFPKNELMADIKRLNRVVVSLCFGGMVLMALAIIFIARSITRPLTDLTQMTDEIAAGNLEASLPRQQTSDEVGKLTGSFNAMQQALKKHIRQLTEATAARERIESELKIAHDIQMGILPKSFPAFPDRQEFDLHATIHPAKEVGGDLYDFFFLDNDHLCLVVGDVSGKGVPAALFMAVTRTLIKTRVAHNLSAHDILSRVNDDLSLDNPSMMFVTLFLAILNVTTGELEYANGGHNPPYLMRSSDGGLKQLESPEGIALGVMPGSVFQSAHIVLAPKDALFIYTDGITEAINSQNLLFSESLLEQGLVELENQPVVQIIQGILDRVIDFAQGTPQADDITMMALRYYGKNNNSPESHC